MQTAARQARELSKNAGYFMNRSTKPSADEVNFIMKTTALGCLALGGVGFFVKLIFVPINALILGGRGM